MNEWHELMNDFLGKYLHIYNQTCIRQGQALEIGLCTLDFFYTLGTPSWHTAVVQASIWTMYSYPEPLKGKEWWGGRWLIRF